MRAGLNSSDFGEEITIVVEATPVDFMVPELFAAIILGTLNLVSACAAEMIDVVAFDYASNA